MTTKDNSIFLLSKCFGSKKMLVLIWKTTPLFCIMDMTAGAKNTVCKIKEKEEKGYGNARKANCCLEI